MPDIGRGEPGLKKKVTSDAELNVCRWRKKKMKYKVIFFFAGQQMVVTNALNVQKLLKTRLV